MRTLKLALLRGLEFLAQSNLLLGVLIALQIFGLYYYLHLSVPVSLPAKIQPYQLPVQDVASATVFPTQSRKKVTPAQKKLASSFLTRGGAAMNNGNFSGAANFFRQAISLDPKNPLFHGALANALIKEGWRREQGRINNTFQNGTASEAWQFFEEATRKNSGFFYFSVPYMARNLLRTDQTASAVAILLAYCPARPKDRDMMILLQNNYYWARQPGFRYSR